MDVGVNYPWCDYGWDFGPAPPGWRSHPTPRWAATIDEHLRHFQRLGISVVRWFVLGDGLTYGTGDQAPRQERAGGRWRFDPPALDSSTLEHFDLLLQRFERASATRPIQLLPVLVDFYFCDAGTHPLERPDPLDATREMADPAWVKQGRAEAIVDADKRRRFLAATLDQFLQVSARRRDAIYAWELINEPEWMTNGWHPDRRSDHPVDEPAMRDFIIEGMERVRRAGFKPTVGFALLDTLRRTGLTGEINQFHHYPGGRRALDAHAFDDRYPGIIGECATAETDVWPELPRSGQGVLNRLRLAERQQYPLTLLWSFLQQDRHSAWSADVEAQVRAFTTAHQRA